MGKLCPIFSYHCPIHETKNHVTWIIFILLVTVTLGFHADKIKSDSVESNDNLSSRVSRHRRSLSDSLLSSTSSSSSSLLLNDPANGNNKGQDKCVYVYDEIETGFISSPNFPNRFPVPLHCRWIIRAPIGNVIVLYLTQFYLKEGFRATEYAFYINGSFNAGANVLIPGFTEGDQGPLVTGKPVLVLEMEVTDDRNIYLRNLDYFLNVFGFNVTFHIVPFTEKVKISSDSCSVYKCSFNGECYLSRDMKSQFCSCFPGFFGRYCQFGPKCDPPRGINPCKNGNLCRYYVGSHFTKCSPIDGFVGEDRSRVTPNNTIKTSVKILKLGLEENMVPTENSKLTLLCLIQSSNSIEVKWYKDSILIDTETSFLRKISTKFSRSEIPGRYHAFLEIDRLYPLDSGIFTCEATDWRNSVNTSLEVKVLVKPEVKVYPLSRTVYQSESFEIVCFSVDSEASVGYNWLKNGEMINPAEDNELIEDLYPNGIRLIVPNALVRAMYTCLATTTLGTVGKDVMLNVIPANITSEFYQTCPKEVYEDVHWPETAIDSVAIETCPSEYKDGGVVRRRCFAPGKWDQADFSGCLSHQMSYIQEKLMSLTLGYRLVSHFSLMNQLKESLNGLRLRPSQGHFVIHLLDSLMAVLKLTTDSLETHDSSQLALDIISSLLSRPHSINSATGLSSLHRLLMEYSFMAVKLKKDQHNHQITRSNFLVEILDLDRRSTNIYRAATISLPTAALTSPALISTSSPSSSPSHSSEPEHIKPSFASKIPSWLTDTVQVDITSLSTFNKSNFANDHQQFKGVLIVFYQNLTQFLPKNIVIRKNFNEIEYQIHSKVITVALVHNNRYITSKPYPLRVTAHLKHHNSIESPLNKKITCGLAQFNERIKFQTNHCKTSPSSTDKSSTICICDITGAYSVLVTSQIKQITDSLPIDIDHLLIFSFGFSILLIVMTILILFIKSRFKLNCIRCLKLQICLATVGVQYSFMATYQPLDSSILSVYIFPSMLFFQLACNCLQISLCTMVYAYITHLNNGRQGLPYMKITFLGWVIPLSITGAAVVASDFDKSVGHDKSFDIGTRYFYYANGGAAIITMSNMAFFSLFMLSTLSVNRCPRLERTFTEVHFILIIILRAKFTKRHKKELLDNFRRLENGTKILNQSLLILFWTDFLLAANIFYRHSRKILTKYVLSLLSCILGLNVILCYGFYTQLDDHIAVGRQLEETIEETPTTVNPDKQDNVYTMNELDIHPTFHRVTLTEFDVHFDPSAGDL